VINVTVKMYCLVKHYANCCNKIKFQPVNGKARPTLSRHLCWFWLISNYIEWHKGDGAHTLWLCTLPVAMMVICVAVFIGTLYIMLWCNRYRVYSNI